MSDMTIPDDLHMRSFEVLDLHWDSDYFEVNCAKAILKSEINSLEGEELVRAFDNYHFITIVNNSNNPKNNNWLGSETSSFLTDINIQFSKKTNNTINHAQENIIVANNFFANEEIIQIARYAFVLSRFYNDPNLNEQKSKELYVNWVRNSFCKEDKYFVISRENDRVTGFLLFSYDSVLSQCVIELIAVEKSFTGQHIGSKLMIELENYLTGINIDSIKVGTQIDNIAAANFYVACGFHYTGCSSIYHYWPKNLGTEKL